MRAKGSTIKTREFSPPGLKSDQIEHVDNYKRKLWVPLIDSIDPEMEGGDKKRLPKIDPFAAAWELQGWFSEDERWPR